jgi:hypothetical protein
MVRLAKPGILAKHFIKCSQNLQHALKCHFIMLAKINTFAKPIFWKNDARLAKFTRAMNKSGKGCVSCHCLPKMFAKFVKFLKYQYPL